MAETQLHAHYRSHAGVTLRPAWVLAGATIAVVALVIAAGWSMVSARSALQRGVHEVHGAESVLHVASLQRAPLSTLRRAEAHIRRAQSDFNTADGHLSWLSSVLPHLGWVPRVGEEVAASPDAARLARETTDALVPLLQGLEPAVADLHHGSSRPGVVQAALGRLAGSHSQFVRACGLLDQARATRSHIHVRHSRTLASGLLSFDRQIPRLKTLCSSLTLLPGLLGWQSPSTYMVAYQNPTELRATGGFIGSLGLLSVSRGSVHQQFWGSGAINDNLSVPPPEPVALYNHVPGWLLRDANWSPNFPTSAQLELFFLKLDLHRTASSVINITPQGVADLLQATGPIYSPEYHRWVTSGNVVALTELYTHGVEHEIGYFANHMRASGPYSYANEDTQRKQFLPILARHLFARLTALSTASVVKLGQSLGTAARTGDLQIYVRQPDAEALIRSLGADGAVHSTSGDYLYAVDTNLSYNKINPYVHKQIDLHVDVRSDGWLDSNLTMRFTDIPAPASINDTSFGPGAGRLGGWRDYATFLRVYVPAGAELISQSGWYQPWSSGTAYGKTMFSGYLIVRAGQSGSVHLHYVVPPNVLPHVMAPTYRLLLQHQPGSHVDRIDVSLRQGTRRIASWTDVAPATDIKYNAPLRGGPYQSIPLPRVPAPVVAPGQWVEPHAFLGVPH